MVRALIRSVFLATLAFHGVQNAFGNPTAVLLAEQAASPADDLGGDGVVDAADVVLSKDVPGIDPAVMMDLMDRSSAYRDTLAGLAVSEENQQLVQWFASEPLVTRVEEIGENVVGELSDGTLFMAINNFEGANTDEGPLPAPDNPPAAPIPGVLDEPPAQSARRAQSAIPGFPEDTFWTAAPHSTIARIHTSLHPRYYSHRLAVDMPAYFEDAGWEVVGDASTMTLDQVRSLDGAGFVLLTAHAGELFDGVFGIGSSSSVTREGIAREKRLLLSRELVLVQPRSYRVDGTPFTSWNFAFTGQFVRNNVRLSEDAIVLMQACRTGGPEAADMVAAWHEAGAGLYLGWDNTIADPDGAVSYRHLIARLLGIQGVASYDKSPVRPFRLTEIVEELKRQETCADESCWPMNRDRKGTTLVVSRKDGSFVNQLAPTIRNMAVNTATDELTLFGSFDDDRDDTTVTVNDEQLSVVSASFNKIVVSLPSTGAGSAGPVVVHHGDVKSNALPLTEYNGVVTYALFSEGGSQFGTATARPRFRVNVQPFRLHPDGTPRYMSEHALLLDPSNVDLATAFGLLPDAALGLATSEADSAFSYSFGGVVEAIDCSGQASISGGGNLPAVAVDLLQPPPPIEPMYFSVFGFNVESAFGSRQFLLSSAAVGAEARVNGDCVEGREPFNPLEGAIGGVDTLQLSGSFDIIPGRQTLDTGFSGIVGDGHIEVNWAFETRFPPDQETESR